MDHIMTYEEYLRDVKKGIVTDLVCVAFRWN